MQKNGMLVINIDAVSDWGFHAVALVIITGAFLFGCWIFGAGLLRVKTPAGALSFLPFVSFLLLWYTLFSRGLLKSLCSVELSAGNGIFRWSWRILRWGREIKVPQHDVTSVLARTKWYGNRLSITMNGKTYSLNYLLDEDMETIARELRRALPDARSAT
jgi:hypothetical protein